VGTTSNNIKAIAATAPLTPEQMAQLNGYTKALDTHQKLSALPADAAKQEYSKLTPAQQQSLKDQFGQIDKKRGWLGTALHYTVDPLMTAVAAPVKLAFKGVTELSDLTTRAYRTGAIMVDQGKGLAEAWTTANDKGDKVFSPNRIAAAQKIYGTDMMNVAQKVASGMTLDEILATGTEGEKQVAAKAAQKKDKLFQEALDAAQAAKYSPGRMIANAVLPGSLEGSGVLYKTISGLGDAAFRIFADPTLVLGKAKKTYDISNYALKTIVKDAGNVEKAFQKASVQRFDTDFTAALTNYKKAQDAFKGGKVSSEELFNASIALKRIAPEWGDEVIKTMLDNGVVEAGTIKEFLASSQEAMAVFTGQAGRQVQLLPRMDAARRLRIAAQTTGNKIIRFDEAGKRVSREIFGDTITPAGVQARLLEKTAFIDSRTGLPATEATPKEYLFQTTASKIGYVEGKTAKLRNDQGFRMPLSYVQDRIDRFASKFSKVPFFKDDFFDPNAPDAAEKVYQLARLANTRYNSRMFAEAFKAGDEAQKRNIMMGVYNTVAEIRGLNKTPGLGNILDDLSKSSREQLFAPKVLLRDKDGKAVLNEAGERQYLNPSEFNNQQFAIFDYQLATGMSVPKIQDLDAIVGKAQVMGRIMSWSHTKWAQDLTSAWSFLTLAGPRFAVRNSIEDLMVHLAVGDGVFGVVAGKRLSTKLRLGKGGDSLSMIGKLVTKKDRALYQEKLAAAETVQDARKIMAEAVMSDKYLGKLDPKARDIIAEMAEHGYIDDMLAAVAEGGKKGLTGADHWTDTMQAVDKFGTMREYTIDGKKYKIDHGGSFQELRPLDTDGKVAWITQIAAVGNDELGSIALRYVSDAPGAENAAVNAIYRKLTSPEYAAQKARYQLYNAGNNADEMTHARNVYAATKNLFTKADGKVNQKLLDKVRIKTPTGGYNINTRGLGIDDLPKNYEDVPEFVIGKKLMPIADGNPAGKIVGKHWNWLGEMNARWSREPLVLSAAVDIRKGWIDAGLEDRYLNSFLDPIRNNASLSAEEKTVLIADATARAKSNIINMTQDLAKERVLAYVDNPDVRTQLAFTMRNFARYYRATEDFYRRVSRTVRYNPESISRLALTYEGVSHSGFVQKDDQGDSYFIYPGMNQVYSVMSGLAKVAGLNNGFVAPMPVEFGAKLNMITPSMNPDSIFPTFSGPLAAFPMELMYRMIPATKDMQKYLQGTYSEDQPIINAILPAHINRALAVLNQDERNSQFASAFRKAATYLEASGHGLKIKTDPNTGEQIPPTAGELEAYSDKLKATTSTVLGMRFFESLILPASPSVNLKSDMANWVKDNQRTNFKQVFSNLVTQYHGDFTKATEEWIRLFPKQMPYTVSESSKKTVAVIRYGEAAGNWVDNNQELLKKYPQAAGFLIPQIGAFNYDSYKTMVNEGLLNKKPMGDFLKEVQSATDRQFYFQQNALYKQSLASTTSVDQKRMLNDSWSQWSKSYMALRPTLAEEFAQGSLPNLRRKQAVSDLRNMFTNEPNPPKGAVAGVLKNMLAVYDQYNAASAQITDRSQASLDRLAAMKEGTKIQLQKLGDSNPNTKSAYDVLFSALIGD
jgi:hypothetical protein